MWCLKMWVIWYVRRRQKRHDPFCPEGHDKPLKYPLIFQVCDAPIINKIDVLPYFDFDLEKVTEFAHMRNPNLEIFPISAKTGEGIDAWCDWLRRQVRNWNNF